MLSRLDVCEEVCELADQYYAHRHNPANINDPKRAWDLSATKLEEAQKAVCQVAISITADILSRPRPVQLIIVPQTFAPAQYLDKAFTSPDGLNILSNFWHEHRNKINAWTTSI